MSRTQLALLALAVAAVAWSAPLVRLAGDVPPLAIAFWRTFVGASVLAIPSLTRRRRELLSMGRRDFLLIVGSAAFLALHFAVWIASIGLTTVASAALIVSATPIFTAVVGGFMGDPVARRGWMGIGIAIAGGVLVGFSDVGRISGAAIGNLLALLGAAAASGYVLIGRRVRARHSVLVYSFTVYAVCAVVLLLTILIARVPLVGFPTSSWLAIAGIALGPQLLGHTTINFLLEHIDATRITVGILGEPVFSALIAAWLFGEIPGWLVVPGGVLLLAGIGTVLYSSGPAQRAGVGETAPAG